MNIKHFVVSTAVVSVGWYLTHNMLELAVEAMQVDLRNLDDNKEMIEAYKTAVRRSFMYAEKVIPKEINKLL